MLPLSDGDGFIVPSSSLNYISYFETIPMKFGDEEEEISPVLAGAIYKELV